MDFPLTYGRTRVEPRAPFAWGETVLIDLPRLKNYARNLRVVVRAHGVTWKRADIADMDATLVIGGSYIMTTGAEHAASIWGDTVTLPCFTPDAALPLHKLFNSMLSVEVKMPVKPVDADASATLACYVEYEGSDADDEGPIAVPIRYAHGSTTELLISRGRTSLRRVFDADMQDW